MTETAFVTKADREGVKLRLNEFFDSTKLTQTQFVERVVGRTGFDLKQPRLSEMLSTGKARLEEIDAIAFAFDLNPGWLAFEFGDKERKHARNPHPKHDEPESFVVPPAKKPEGKRKLG